MGLQLKDFFNCPEIEISVVPMGVVTHETIEFSVPAFTHSQDKDLSPSPKAECYFHFEISYF